MAKVVFTKFNRAKPGDRAVSVTEKRMRTTGTGHFVTVRTIDAGSRTLGQDLDYVFGRNVARARRDNKAVIGAVDRAPAKP